MPRYARLRHSTQRNVEVYRRPVIARVGVRHGRRSVVAISIAVARRVAVVVTMSPRRMAVVAVIAPAIVVPVPARLGTSAARDDRGARDGENCRGSTQSAHPDVAHSNLL